MTDNYFLVLDKEKKKLVDKFNDIHPDGGELVFNLLLKFYIKFAVWHRKKGRNPINAFEDLIERELKGGPYSTDLTRLKFLNEIIEKGEDAVLSGMATGSGTSGIGTDSSAAGGYSFNEEATADFKNELKKEINSVKDLILSMKASGSFGRSGGGGGGGGTSLDDFKPDGAAMLTKVEGEIKPKKRLNYRDLRSKDGVKKINFDE